MGSVGPASLVAVGLPFLLAITASRVTNDNYPGIGSGAVYHYHYQGPAYTLSKMKINSAMICIY
jgi:hypothetical protein